MYTTRIFFLFCFFVVFGAYAEYNAGKNLKRLKVRDRRPSEQERGMEDDTVFTSRVIEVRHIAEEKAFGNLLETVIERERAIARGKSSSIINKPRIENVFLCISAEEITSFDLDLKVQHRLEGLSDGQHERDIPQIRIR